MTDDMNTVVPFGARWNSGACSHPGSVRPINEDGYLDRPDLGLWAVADGMGGYQAGEVASAMVIAELDKIPRPRTGPGFMAEVKARIGDANGVIRREAVRRGPGVVMGATVVALLLLDSYFACVWAGDSRIYLLRGGRLNRLTRDHSYVQDLIEQGLLTPEAAEGHPYANVVTRAVGAEDALMLDATQARLFPGDTFLLCSDGLTRAMAEADIHGLLGAGDAVGCARGLVEEAVARGASDNVTAVVIKLLR